MKNRLIIANLAIALIFSTASFATSSALATHQLVEYPDVNSIIAAGLNNAEPTENGTWAVYKQDRYGSDRDWIFVISRIKANDVKSANSKAKEALPTLKFQDGPHNDAGLLTCNYKVNLDVVVAALSVGDRLDSNNLR